MSETVMNRDVIFTPLAVSQPHGQEPHLSLEYFRPVRQRGRLAHPDPHQLGMQVRRRRRRRHHLVLCAGADGRPDHCRIRHHPPRRFHSVVAPPRRRRASVRLQVHHAAQPLRTANGPSGGAQFPPSDPELDQPQGVAARVPVPGCRQGGDRTAGERIRRRGETCARGGPRRRRAACRQRLPVHPVPFVRHQRSLATSMAERCRTAPASCWR